MRIITDPTDHNVTVSDEEIVARYRETGRKDLIGELFRRHNRFVFLVCMKYLEDEEEARDATMAVFEHLMEALRRHEVKTFRPWLHAVTKNHCLGFLRIDRHRKTATEEISLENEQVMESGAFLHLEDNHEQRLKNLEDAILMLNKEQRICIELFYLKKMRYQEIAALTGSTFERVKSHIQNGKRNLQILMSKPHE